MDRADGFIRCAGQEGEAIELRAAGADSSLNPEREKGGRAEAPPPIRDEVNTLVMQRRPAARNGGSGS